MNAHIFNQDFENLTNYLRACAMKLTRDTVLAEDLFQDTALLVFKNREKFQEGTNMKAWVSTIMRNTYINGFRKKKRLNMVVDNSEDNLYINNEGGSIANDGEGKMTLDELTMLIEQLDDKYKQPFMMAYRGYSYDEICQQTDTALGTVKSRIFFARKKLQAKIAKMYGERRPSFAVA